MELGHKRLKQCKLYFQSNVVKSIIADLIKELSFNGNQANPKFTERLKLTLLRLSNVLRLVIKDDSLFLPANQYPLDFLNEIIRIMLEYHNYLKIGECCLELLTKILQVKTTLQNGKWR